MNRLIIVIFTAKNMMRNIYKKKKLSLHNITTNITRQRHSRLLKLKTKEETLEGSNYNYPRESTPRKTMNFARKTSHY